MVPLETGSAASWMQDSRMQNLEDRLYSLLIFPLSFPNHPSQVTLPFLHNWEGLGPSHQGIEKRCLQEKSKRGQPGRRTRSWHSPRRSICCLLLFFYVLCHNQKWRHGHTMWIILFNIKDQIMSQRHLTKDFKQETLMTIWTIHFLPHLILNMQIFNHLLQVFSSVPNLKSRRKVQGYCFQLTQDSVILESD